VKTVSTRPPRDLFTKDAATIARTIARRSVSPKGLGSGVRMIQFFINRAGRSLSATRRRDGEGQAPPAGTEQAIQPEDDNRGTPQEDDQTPGSEQLIEDRAA
jgi:hypothetical protein